MSKENIGKFVNSLQKGDNTQVADDLKNALADKVSSALDDAKTDVARSTFTGPTRRRRSRTNVFSGNDISAETPATPEASSDEVDLSNFIKDNITEANDYKRTRQYNKLTPKMKRAVDMVFRMVDKDGDVIANFEKNVNNAAKQFGVSKQDLMNYFDKETLTILRIEMGTFILKGSGVAGTLSDNDIGKAHFVRIVATVGTNTITVKDGSTTLGTTLLHSAQ